MLKSRVSFISSVISNSFCEQWYWTTSKTWQHCNVCSACAPPSAQSDLSAFRNSMCLLSLYSFVNRLFHICRSRLSNIYINYDRISKGLLPQKKTLWYEKWICLNISPRRMRSTRFFYRNIKDFQDANETTTCIMKMSHFCWFTALTRMLYSILVIGAAFKVNVLK